MLNAHICSGDHDIALAYVLDFYASALPSFDGLAAEHKRSVRFTQSKMSFNHGWLVQGEAPPGPLFAKFKQVMMTEDVAPQDVRRRSLHSANAKCSTRVSPSPVCVRQPLELTFLHSCGNVL